MEEAEQKQKNDEPPKYEVEIELEKPREEISKKRNDDLAVATSLLLKVYSVFIPIFGNSVFFDWVPRT